MGKHHHLKPMTMEPTPEQFAEWLAKAEKEFPPDAVYCLFEKDGQYTEDKAGHWKCLRGEIARLAYAAGADAELEACVEWIRGIGLILDLIPHLYAARRPKPPSLKQQALRLLQGHETNGEDVWLPSEAEWNTIRRALESLPDD